MPRRRGRDRVASPREPLLPSCTSSTRGICSRAPSSRHLPIAAGRRRRPVRRSSEAHGEGLDAEAVGANLLHAHDLVARGAARVRGSDSGSERSRALHVLGRLPDGARSAPRCEQQDYAQRGQRHSDRRGQARKPRPDGRAASGVASATMPWFTRLHHADDLQRRSSASCERSLFVDRDAERVGSCPSPHPGGAYASADGPTSTIARWIAARWVVLARHVAQERRERDVAVLVAAPW